MKRTIVAGSAVLLAIACLVSVPHHTTAQTTYSQPVKVVNTGASQAIPVQPQGTTPVSGTVTVGNTTLPVTVSNDADHSVPVRVGVTGWALQTGCSSGIPGGPGSCWAYNQDVMANVVIQTIACNGQFATTGDTAYVQVMYRYAGGDYGILEFPMQRVGPGMTGGMDEYSGIQNMSIPLSYSRLRIFPTHFGSTATGPIYCTAAGYQF